MPAYLARLEGDRQLVGFFTVNDDAELFWLIDECCDPNMVEITELGTGGIYWGRTIELTVPIATDENGESDYEGLPSGENFSAGWAEKMFADDALIWRPVPIVQDI